MKEYFKIFAVGGLLSSTIFFIFFTSTKGYTQISASVRETKVLNLDLNTQDNLIKVKFLDEKHGWVISENTIFKTQDGGVTWKHIRLNLFEQEKLSGIAFQNLRFGNAIIQKLANGLESKSNQVKILQSINGGVSWKLVKTIDDGVLQNIVFGKKGDGWIVGYRKKGMSSIGYTYLVLHSNDKGKVWKDISSQIETEFDNGNNTLNNKLQRKIVLNASVTSVSSVQLLLWI